MAGKHGYPRTIARTHSLRRTSGKQPGGQLGHPGEMRHGVADPDASGEQRPAVRSACQRPVEGEAQSEAPLGVARERRQVRVFLDDLTIPFDTGDDTTLAERDLLMLTTRPL